MAHTTCEMMWMMTLLGELDFCEDGLMSMYCDNQAVIYIASNPAFHKRTKHIEVDCHFVRNVVARKLFSTFFTPSLEEVADMFTKHVAPRVFLIYVTSRV